jgi:hypothetical protein
MKDRQPRWQQAVIKPPPPDSTMKLDDRVVGRTVWIDGSTVKKGTGYGRNNETGQRVHLGSSRVVQTHLLDPRTGRPLWMPLCLLECMNEFRDNVTHITDLALIEEQA